MIHVATSNLPSFNYTTIKRFVISMLAQKYRKVPNFYVNGTPTQGSLYGMHYQIISVSPWWVIHPITTLSLYTRYINGRSMLCWWLLTIALSIPTEAVDYEYFLIITISFTIIFITVENTSINMKSIPYTQDNDFIINSIYLLDMSMTTTLQQFDYYSDEIKVKLVCVTA